MLTQPHRRSIHTSLTPILGEEETDALVAQFPASESDLPATKSDLTLLRSDIHQEFANFRAEIHDLFRQMAMWVAIAMITGMGISAGIAQAVGGG